MAGMAHEQVAATVTAAGNGTTSVNVALPERLNGGVIRVLNLNTVPGFLQAGIGAQTATAAGAPFAASGITDIKVGAADNVAFVLQAAGTSNVYLTPGSQG